MAKSLCYKEGLELATIPEGQVRDVSEEITIKDSSVHTVWVGLRKSEFSKDMSGRILFLCFRNILQYHFIVFKII